MASETEDMSKETYPSGLVLFLEEEELDKLGLDTSEHKVGDEISLDAVAKIVSVREKGMCLQITELGVETDKDSDARPVKTAGERLFGEQK